jgi:phage terminase large subunit-like protein
VFPPHDDDKKWRVLANFFLPEDNIQVRVKRDQVPYDHWQRKGMFQLTPGNVIDYDFIRVAVLNLAEQYDIREIGYDRYNAQQIVTQFDNEGLTLVPINQSTAGMWAPSKFLMELVLRGEFAHGGNPILRWMASNTVVVADGSGAYRPDKEHSNEKIDGIVATVIALARGMVHSNIATPSFFVI